MTLDHEKREIRARMYLTAEGQARTYAEQLDRSIGQLDYIMLSMQFHWQQSGGALQLEQQVQAGLVPKGMQIVATIFDKTGRPITSTNPAVKNLKGIASREFFMAHATSPGKELVISKPVRSILSGHDVILLSRRLDNPDASFAGVIVIPIEPEHIASFVDETKINKDDFISIRRSDGAFFVAKTRDGIRSERPNYRGVPAFPTSSGVRVTPARQYIDGHTRIVAWQAAKSYPVIAVVGLSEMTQLDGYRSREGELFLIAGFGSLALLLSGGAGMWYSASRIRRAEYFDEVHRAYRLATENAREGFYMLRPVYEQDGRIADFLVEDCNERGAAYRGMQRKKLLGSSLMALLPGAFGTHMLAKCRTAMETGFVEDEMWAPSHESRPAKRFQRRLIRSEAGLAVTLRDITESKKHQQTLVRLANSDILTSLPNRYWLMNYLSAAIRDAGRNGKHIAVMFVDLDGFKDINDTLGHSVGDEFLKAAALRLKALIGPEDKVARLGGDEFTVVVADADSHEKLIAIAEHVITALATPYVIGEHKHLHTLCASIGISRYPDDGKDGEALLKQADIAMYAAKANGKGTYCFFDLRQEERVVTRLTQQAGLKQAIERGELTLHYQPRVRGDTGEITSMEALVRWIHPARGIIPPNEFIPLAEETGLIVPLGAAVINMACEQLACWKVQSLPVVPVSVNVSARQIEKEGVCATLAEALAKHGLDVSLIEVEVTESAMVGEGNTANAELSAIQAMGIRLYVDDFGTGYSCLAQLKHLDMDGLKIDRAFTTQLLSSPADAALFKAIVSMGQALVMRVVAEGVETAGQLAALQALSCDEVQGYFISKPVPADEAGALLQKRFLFPGA